MDIVRREMLTPDEAGLPFMRDDRWAVLLYRLRCTRGCVGTFRAPIDRALPRDVAALASFEEAVLEYADAHICLRKAKVGDPHACAACGSVAEVDQRGRLRVHKRYVGDPDVDWWGGAPGGVDTETCPGAEMQPGRWVR